MGTPLKLKRSAKRRLPAGKPLTAAADPPACKVKDLYLAAAAPSERIRLVAAMLLLGVGCWAYWPTLVELAQTWGREPDYSHGFFVAPVALLFLWFRRQSAPAMSDDGWVVGLMLLALSVTLRYVGARYFLSFIDGWSMVIWVSAGIAVLAGRNWLWWSLPAVAFLMFMTPLPFSAEGVLRFPLQRIATKLSCYVFQLLGHAAYSEGNVILLGDQRLEVAQACSGLRLFVSIFALAYAYAVLTKRGWFDKVLLLLGAVPIAVIANTGRIVSTGLLLQVVSSNAAKQMSHDIAGWLSILLAAGLFGLQLWYLGVLFPEEEVLDSEILVREARMQSGLTVAREAL